MNFRYLKKGIPSIAESVLKSLPDWFGLEEATKNYINNSQELPMLIAYEKESPVGFISIKKHTPSTSELYVMGVHPQFHLLSHGKQMIAILEKHLINEGVEFLQAKTLSEDRECNNYLKTRLSYNSQGFKEVEVFPTLWGKDNPCLLMIKALT